jgi:hypothetical protein
VGQRQRALEAVVIAAFEDFYPDQDVVVTGHMDFKGCWPSLWLTIWEQYSVKALATEGPSHAYFHQGFWRFMDTGRDKRVLQDFWATPNAPWKIWSE